MMKKLFKKHWLRVVTILVGALGGYLYYHYVGCVSGTCPITSNPYNMVLYGALVGYFLSELFGDMLKRGKGKAEQ